GSVPAEGAGADPPAPHSPSGSRGSVRNPCECAGTPGHSNRPSPARSPKYRLLSRSGEANAQIVRQRTPTPSRDRNYHCTRSCSNVPWPSSRAMRGFAAIPGGRGAEGDIVNCYSELENMGKILFSRTRRRSSSQVRVAALSEGGLKSQSGCSLQNPRLGAERRVALDALTNSLQVGLKHRGIDGLEPVRSAQGRDRAAVRPAQQRWQPGWTTATAGRFPPVQPATGFARCSDPATRARWTDNGADTGGHGR